MASAPAVLSCAEVELSKVRDTKARQSHVSARYGCQTQRTRNCHQYICLHKARKGKMVDLPLSQHCISFQLSSFAFTALWSTTSIRFHRWVGLSKDDHKLPFIHVPRLGIIFIPRVTERMYRHVMMIYSGFFRNASPFQYLNLFCLTTSIFLS